MFEYIHRVWFKRSFCLSIFISFSFDLYFRWHSITGIAFFCFCWTFNWALHLFWNIWSYQCAACVFFIFSSLYLTFVYTLEFCNLGFVFVFFSVFVSVFVFLCHLYAPGDSATFSSKGSVSLFEILKGSSCAWEKRENKGKKYQKSFCLWYKRIFFFFCFLILYFHTLQFHIWNFHFKMFLGPDSCFDRVSTQFYFIFHRTFNFLLQNSTFLFLILRRLFCQNNSLSKGIEIWNQGQKPRLLNAWFWRAGKMPRFFGISS